MAAGFVPNEFRAVLLEAIAGRAAIPAPTSLTLGAVSAAGGALGAGTYYYKITYTNVLGETVGSNEIVTAALTGTTNQVPMTFPAGIASATGINIYRGTATNAESVLLASLARSATAYTDAGAATTAGAPPGTNTTSANLTGALYLGLAYSLPIDPLTSSLANITEVTGLNYARVSIPAFLAASTVVPIQIVEPTAFSIPAGTAVLSADMPQPAYYAFITNAASGTVGKIRYIFELPEAQQGRSGEQLLIPASALILE